jgi:type II secretory pathway pseudopilin PulG
MVRRSGLTLVEVLVAIFVMGIGLIALLTLFPIGILQMANAIKQDRCARCALNADSMALLLNVRNDPKVISDTAPVVPDYFKNPYPFPNPGALADADPYAASYAIMVDPHGYVTTKAQPVSKAWIGGSSPLGSPKGFLTRRPINIIWPLPPAALPAFKTQSTYIKQYFSLLDDPVFENNPLPLPPGQSPGTPKQLGGNAIMRDSPFTWTYLLQRPRTGEPSVVNCSIVVFENRPLLLTNVGTALSLPEIVYPGATFDLNANTITVATAVPPNVRPGDWLYDATVIKTPAMKYPEIASGFYRVVAVDQTALGLRYEVQQPLRKMINDPTRTVFPNAVIAMDGIVEVFEKGPVRVP